MNQSHDECLGFEVVFYYFMREDRGASPMPAALHGTNHRGYVEMFVLEFLGSHDTMVLLFQQANYSYRSHDAAPT